MTSLSLSLGNLRCKKGRTLLTAAAAAVGIVGIALILSLSAGVNDYIDDLQKNTMSAYPITLTEKTSEMTSLLGGGSFGASSRKKEENALPSEDNLYVDYTAIEDILSFSSVTNNLKAFKRYLEEEGNAVAAAADLIVYGYDIPFTVYSYDRDGKLVSSDADMTELPADMDVSEETAQGAAGPAANMERINSVLSGSTGKNGNFSELLHGTDGDLVNRQIKENYELAYGNWPSKFDEVLLVMDGDNSIDMEVLYQLGLLSQDEVMEIVDSIRDGEDMEGLAGSYGEISQHCFFLMHGDADYTEPDSIRLSISGIIRPRAGAENANISTAVAYTSALTDVLIERTGTNRAKPSSISIYVESFENKEAVIAAIEDYNFHVSRRNRITYTDYAELLTSTVMSMVNIISYVLIAFVAVSLIVSGIMIAIITHISVMERTKEIGILRAMGASKADISQVFNAETALIGFCSGILGVGLAAVLSIPLNAVVQNALGIGTLHISLPVIEGVLLMVLAICITVIAGMLPARKAARQNVVAALRSE